MPFSRPEGNAPAAASDHRRPRAMRALTRLVGAALCLAACAPSDAQTPAPHTPAPHTPAPQTPAPWPGPERTEQALQRQKSFPIKTLVADVDWYQPQETVKGVAHPQPLPLRVADRRTIGPDAIAAALAYAEAQKSYALLVWRNGALELEHYWPGFDRTSRYETASMAKTVLALGIGAAVADGKIKSVGDPIATYLPQLAGTHRGALPLRAYLEMVTGIETPAPGLGDPNAGLQYNFGSDLNDTVAHWPDTCTPLTQFCYANANPHYLGWALTGAVGMRYADWLSQTIWRPIGAGNAALYLDHPGGSPRYSCCLLATAQDWVRVGRLLLDKGKADGHQVVPARWIAQMTAPSPANANYGWLIWRGSPYNPARRYGPHIKLIVPAAQPFLRDDVVYLDGSAGQRVYVIPSARMVVVRIGTPSFDWDDSKLVNLLLAGAK